MAQVETMLRFWKINRLNEKLSELRLMDSETWSKINQVCMEIWNLKFDGNMHFKFKEIFGVITEVHFGQFIYHFEALEVRNPMF